MIKLFVGLGNYLPIYHLTRHNIGYLAVAHYLLSHKERPRFEEKLKSKISVLNDCIFALPQVYMNESGEIIKLLLDTYLLSPSEILILYDDVTIEFGKMKLKPKGSAGQHKGLESIIQAINTEEFPRLKIGVGPLPQNTPLKDYVLEKFSDEEIKKLPEILTMAKKVLGSITTKGLSYTMTLLNKDGLWQK